jgi:hypothetical protein
VRSGKAGGNAKPATGNNLDGFLVGRIGWPLKPQMKMSNIMNYSRTLRFLFCAVLVLGFSTAGFAQASRTWVSGVGDDVNPCSRTAPCKTFAGAISKTAAGGEINCLDSGGFGTLTTTKSITVKCEGCIGGILAAGTFGVTVNDSASATPNTAIVTLSGLDIEGFNTGTNGIRFFSGAKLHVHKTQIRDFRQSGGGGNGILIDPNTTAGGPKKITVADSYITDNGSTANNAGILIRPTGNANVNVSVNNTQMEANTSAIFMDGSGGAGASNLSVSNSIMTAGSINGIAVSSTGGAFVATVDNSTMSLNVGVGAAVAGAQGTLRLGNNTIVSNVTGVSNSGGTLQSFKNNQIAGNGADGTPIAAVSSGGLITN